jgi:hypothetical protein
MNHNITIAVLILLCLGLLLFLLVYYTRKQEQANKAKLVKQFQNTALDNRMEITQQEVFRNRIVGLDENTKKLLYVVFENHQYRSSITELDENYSCEIIKVGQTIGGTAKDKNSEFHVNEIRLEVTPKQKPGIVITFYSEIHEGALQLADGLRIAEKWKNYLLSKSLNFRPAN